MGRRLKACAVPAPLPTELALSGTGGGRRTGGQSEHRTARTWQLSLADQ
ncbi:hypothetical protein [Comamonas sp. JC664]